MEPIVNVPIGDYDALREKVKKLGEENTRLKESLVRIAEEGKILTVCTERVIEKPTLRLFDEDREAEVRVDIEVKNYDDVKDETIYELQQRRSKLEEKVKFLEGKLLQSDMEVSRLKRRTLWQRIRNK